jgi:hypothetical protein
MPSADGGSVKYQAVVGCNIPARGRPEVPGGFAATLPLSVAHCTEWKLHAAQCPLVIAPYHKDHHAHQDSQLFTRNRDPAK